MTQIKKDKTELKLVIITRNDLTNGFKAQQSTHAIADFAYEFPKLFNNWKITTNSIICLSVNNEEELNKLYHKLSGLTSVTKFNEPDLNDELTSICVYGTPEVRKMLSNLPLLGKEPKYNYRSVLMDMIKTPQTNTQNVLEHGLSVNKYFNDLIVEQEFNWKIPTWYVDNAHFILTNLHKIADINEYQIFHDLGKPYCIEYDENGRKHFPNHAKVSAEIYGKISNNDIVKELILNDMVLHTIKSEDIPSFLETHSIETILTLLVTALCELHSNAEMFGGIESDSFKIKFKQLDRRGKQIMKLINDKL